MMDADRDGFIGENDLRDIHMNLGRQPSEADLKKMLAECPGQLNFTSFLTLFGEKMHGENKARFKWWFSYYHALTYYLYNWQLVLHWTLKQPFSINNVGVMQCAYIYFIKDAGIKI